MSNKNIINYKVGQKNHDIEITNNIIQTIKKKINLLKSDSKIFFVYDKNIDKKIVNEIFLGLKLSGCKIYKKEISTLKVNKNLKAVISLIDEFSEKSLTKKSVVIGCGGGVLGDVTALAASLYRRGLIYLNIPSTMTAIVDSSIGGKTAINHLNQINLIGTYFHPTSVIIYSKILTGLPDREYKSGLAEVLKCAILKKNKLINIIEKDAKKILSRDSKLLKILILNSLKIKIGFFLKDIYEENNRLKLNFGHTFAHAYEMATDEMINSDYLRHGEAVALGIISEIVLSYLETKSKNQKKKINEVLVRVKKILENLLLPIKLNVPSKIDNSQLSKLIYYYVFKDKKKISPKPRYIKLTNLGKISVSEINDFDNISKVIYYILNDIDINQF
jgi:3-dehydroquinate synthase